MNLIQSTSKTSPPSLFLSFSSRTQFTSFYSEKTTTSKHTARASSTMILMISKCAQDWSCMYKCLKPSMTVANRKQIVWFLKKIGLAGRPKTFPHTNNSDPLLLLLRSAVQLLQQNKKEECRRNKPDFWNQHRQEEKTKTRPQKKERKKIKKQEKRKQRQKQEGTNQNPWQSRRNSRDFTYRKKPGPAR